MSILDDPREFVKLYIIVMTTYYSIIAYENGRQTRRTRINVLLELLKRHYGISING